MENKDCLIPAGNLEDELMEIEKLDASNESADAASITNFCGNFFTIICC